MRSAIIADCIIITFDEPLSIERRDEMIRISSWNMQGGALHKFSQIRSADIGFETPDVFLMQESGVPGTTGVVSGKDYLVFEKYYKCMLADDPLAKNRRCTVSILCSTDLPYSFDRGFFDGSQTRDIPFVVLGKTLIASLHAPANGEPDYIRSVLNILVRKTADSTNYFDRWILMGDMNVEPDLVLDYTIRSQTGSLVPNVCNVLNLRSTTRPHNIGMVFPSSPTHRGTVENKVLDYAFVSDKLITPLTINNWRLFNSYMHYDSNALSDHNMVSIALPEMLVL